MQRTFNRPSGLAVGQSIRLILGGLAKNAIVKLNDQTLSALNGGDADSASLTFEIADRMCDHNTLQIDVCLSEPVTQSRDSVLSSAELLIDESPR